MTNFNRLPIGFPVCLIGAFLAASSPVTRAEDTQLLTWETLPAIPDELGFAGPFAGVHHDALIVAGGANFPKPVWENDVKYWHDRIFVLTRDGDDYKWQDGGKLDQPTAYGAAVSTADGVVCMGGNDRTNTFDDVFVLRWDPVAKRIIRQEYPSLPKPCAFAAATLVGNTIYLAGGQSSSALDSAMSNFWSLDLSQQDSDDEFRWQELPPVPGPTRALNLTVQQHNGTDDCVYVISGRRQRGADIQFLRDVWEFTPRTGKWRARKDAPRCVMAGTGIGIGQSQIFVLGGADGSLFFRGNELKNEHPGFIKQALAYNTITNKWIEAGTIPENHVTTIAVKWDDSIIIPSGEIRPRVRSPNVYRVTPIDRDR